MLNKKQKQTALDFDMGNLPDGIYTLEVSDKNNTTIRRFQVGEDSKIAQNITNCKYLVAIN